MGFFALVKQLFVKIDNLCVNVIFIVEHCVNMFFSVRPHQADDD